MRPPEDDPAVAPAEARGRAARDTCRLTIDLVRPPGMEVGLALGARLLPLTGFRRAMQALAAGDGTGRQWPGRLVADVSSGRQAILLTATGFRPTLELVRAARPEQAITLPARLMPASTPVEERELFRPGERHPQLAGARRFLGKYGYLSPCGCGAADLCPHLEDALRRFQRLYRLETTGSLTVETYLLMLQPRCGRPDTALARAPEASAGPPGVAGDPIVFLGNRWDTFNLKYRVLTGTRDISNEWSIVRAALRRWSRVTPLTFTRTTDADESHLEFDFRRPSEPSYPFDEDGGEDGNTLAHAWGPDDGLVEFDDDEDWDEDGFLLDVAVHEIGHALGLDHSSVEEATMFPWYDEGWSSLHEVDIRGIKSLYPPVFGHPGPFVAYPLYAFESRGGTDTVTIDLGRTTHFLAWGTITMIDSLAGYDRDNTALVDVYEVDGVRTDWRVSGSDHYGSAGSPANAFRGAVASYGRRVSFRLTAAHHMDDLAVSGFAIVLVLEDGREK